MMLYVTYGPIDLETRQGPKGTTLDLDKDALKRFWENAQEHAQKDSCLSMKLSKAAETQRMSHRGFQSLCHIRVRTVQLPPTSL